MRYLILAFALGVCACQRFSQLPALSPLLWACALLAGVACCRLGRLRLVLLGLLACALGLSWAVWRSQLRLDEALTLALEGQDVAVIGEIADLPERTAYGLRSVLRVHQGPAGVPQMLLISWYAGRKAEPPALRAGELWQVTLRLHRPHGNRNPHGFDYEAWLFERGIRAVGYVRPQGAYRLADLADGAGPRLQRMRQLIRERIEAVLPEGQWRGVLSALAVGDQSAVPAEQWRLFSQTGVTHLMSISGGHVTLFAALIAWLARHLWARVPALCLRLPAQKAAVLGGAFAAAFYVLLAGFGVPAQRTLYMLLAVCAGLWLGRTADAWRSLAMGLLLVMLYDPWVGLSPGFWLSFGAVAALLWAGLAAGRQAAGWRSWLLAQWRAQWAIIVLSLPILLGLFQQFSLVSPLANAIAIPLISAVVTPLILAFAVLPLPSLAELAHWLLAGLMQVLLWLSSLSLATWQQAAPPAWLVAAGVFAAFWALLPRAVPGRIALFGCCLPLLCWTPLRPLPGQFSAVVLDVGQGLAVHVQTATHDLLFDAGPQYSTDSDSGERVIFPYLRAAGVRRLDRMFVSHDDSDHSGGALALLRLLPVGELWGSLPAQSPIVQRAGGQHACRRGESWDWDGVRFELLHPAADSGSAKDNDQSCVLRIADARWSLLLTADIEAASESELLAWNPAALRSTVMVAPHHGSKTSSQPAFIAAVGAQQVIFTSGYRNRFRHPAPEVLARYAEADAALYRSDLHGAVLLGEDNGGAHLLWERRVHARYWQGH
jgi:competence protein ComEC